MKRIDQVFPPYPLPPANEAGVYMNARRLEIYYVHPYGVCAWIYLEYVWDGQQGCVNDSYNISECGFGQSGCGPCAIDRLVQGQEAFKEHAVFKIKQLEETFKAAIRQTADKCPTHTRRALKALETFRASFAPATGQQATLF